MQRFVIKNLDTGLELKVDDFERLTTLSDEVRHGGTCAGTCAPALNCIMPALWAGGMGCPFRAAGRCSRR